MLRGALLCVVLLLMACAPTPASRATPTAGLPPPQEVWPEVAVSIDPAPASATKVTSGPSSAPPGDASDPATISRACHVDADCAVKNIGSCCGQYPACVNKDAATDPAGVRARCGKEHRMGICSVPAVAGCSCVAGQCRDINAADLRPDH